MSAKQQGHVLYISYTGLLEPLGQSQIYRYLANLAENHEITLITYEKPGDLEQKERVNEVRQTVHEAGIEWIPLQYHRTPSLPATLWDLLVGFVTCVRVLRRNNIEIVHARSYIPSVLALLCKRLFGTKFIFDMRGFWADERVDGDIWDADSRVYRVAKQLETQFISHADVIVSLTDSGIDTIRGFDHVNTEETDFRMIPTCVDLELFTSESIEEQADFTLGYVGSVGTWYLFDDVLDCYELLRERKPNAQLSILNKGDHELIREKLRKHDIDESAVSLKSVNHEEVAQEMNRMDAGIFLIKPLFSKKGSCPTKMGEFLGCGVPCLSNTDVGDVELILEDENVGVAIEEFTTEEKRRGIDRLLELTADDEIDTRCRSVAERYFSLESGVEEYDKIYDELLSRDA